MSRVLAAAPKTRECMVRTGSSWRSLAARREGRRLHPAGDAAAVRLGRSPAARPVRVRGPRPTPFAFAARTPEVSHDAFPPPGSCTPPAPGPWPGRSPADLPRPPPGDPQRLVVVFTPNGFLRDRWLPTGEERDFLLNATMAPLEPFRDQLIIVDGLYNQAAERSRGPVVERGLATLLTGRERAANLAAGPSLDQAVAQLPAGRSRPTLQLGVKTKAASPGRWPSRTSKRASAAARTQPPPGPATTVHAQRNPAPARSGHGGGAGRHREEPGAGAAVAVGRRRPDAGGAPGGHHRAARPCRRTGSLAPPCRPRPWPTATTSRPWAGRRLTSSPRPWPATPSGWPPWCSRGQRAMPALGTRGVTTTWRWPRAPTRMPVDGWGTSNGR